MQLSLRIISYQRLTPGQQERFFVTTESLTIGSSSNCDWTIPDPQRFLSGVHCKIECHGDDYCLTDLSTNGVFLNGSDKRIPRNGTFRLAKGDLLRMGDYEFEVEFGIDRSEPEQEEKVKHAIPRTNGPVEEVTHSTINIVQLVLERFNPKKLESSLYLQSFFDRLLPSRKKAKLWDSFVLLHDEIVSNLVEDPQSMFGSEFSTAYEEELPRLVAPLPPHLRKTQWDSDSDENASKVIDEDCKTLPSPDPEPPLFQLDDSLLDFNVELDDLLNLDAPDIDEQANIHANQSRSEPNYQIRQLFFATDRKMTGDSAPEKAFGRNRGELVYGICSVSIPRVHRMGELEKPSFFRLEFRDDPKKHIVLWQISLLKTEYFFKAMDTIAGLSNTKEALVFVHGYNVSFEDAAKRTAQMAYDLAFAGPTAFFSWPSKASIGGYPADETTIAWATPHLKLFLEQIAKECAVDTIHVIAHSMGNRGLTQALGMIADSDELEVRSKFRQIVLTAPDIDKDIFVSQIYPKLAKLSARITLYASSRDKALIASKKFHQFPRAGDAGEGLVILEGLDTVDATKVDTSFLGHSYFADNRSVISDMFYVIGHAMPPQRRVGLEAVHVPVGDYWKFRL